MSQNLDKIRHNVESIKNQARLIQSLAEAFYTVGNVNMSETLSCVADSILDSTTNISAAITDEVTMQFNTAMESSGNLVKAIISSRKSKNAG